MIRHGLTAAWARILALVMIAGVLAAWQPARANAAAGDAGTFVSLPPTRVLDTRIGNGAMGPVGANKTVSIQITGRAGVPISGVSAVVLNVTVTNATGNGYITVYPYGTTKPNASNLNYPMGDTRANLVTVKLGTQGKISLTNNSLGTVQLVGDVAGYYRDGTTTAAGTFHSLSPVRVLDTRIGTGATGPVGANATINVPIAGQGGVPATGVSAVVINVTETNALGNGYITVFPSGTPKPTASNLNYPKGDTRAVLVTVQLGADGKIALANNSLSTVQLVGDVAGYFLAGATTAAGTFASLTPARVLDTRIGNGATGPVGPNATINVQITGRGGVDSGASAVVINVTETNALGSGYITVYPYGTPKPTASNLNFPKGDTRANLVTVKLGIDGKISLTNNSLFSVHLVADVAGYYRPSVVKTFSGTGEFQVGTQLGYVAPDTYRTINNSADCYWARASLYPIHSDSDIIASATTDWHDVVTIAGTDRGFYTENCSTWTSDLSAITTSPTAPFGSGTMIVNTDIASGHWAAPGGSNCYWERLSGFSGTAGDVIVSADHAVNPVVTIAGTDKGFQSHNCGTWTKQP